jgi:hemolysin activation/secretion protein
MLAMDNRGTIFTVVACCIALCAWLGGTALAQEGQLPADTSVKFAARELVLQGNTHVTTADILKGMPAVYNVSGKPAKEAKAEDLYDLAPIKELAANPGEEHFVTVRTIQGFTKYVLSEYQRRGMAGVYVYVPAGTVVEGVELKDQRLIVEVIEASISTVGVNLYNVDKEKKETSYMNVGVLKEWSPAKPGSMMNEKKVDNFVEQINQNPDKHVTAVVSKGEDKTLDVSYDLYERNPWHFYLQADSSGSDKRAWSPKVGVINTDLTGRMDRATFLYQANVNDPGNNYALYGSYETPLWTPDLKLQGFAGYSEYDTNPVGTGGFQFLGRGYFYGGKLRYTLLQYDRWFFDVTGGAMGERSRNTPNLFASELASDVHINYWTSGAELHKNDELTATSIAWDRYTSFGGSSDEAFNQARTNTDRTYWFDVFTASRSQFLDVQRVHRILASGRYVDPGERLTPSAMTTFGGLYSVRGYHEDEVVADGGFIGSLQYEYDLIASMAKSEQIKGQSPKKEFVRRLAPVLFTDMGRARILNPVPGEQQITEMASWGTGLVTTLGDHFDGAVYYGWAMRSTQETNAGSGQWGASLLLRW